MAAKFPHGTEPPTEEDAGNTNKNKKEITSKDVAETLGCLFTPIPLMVSQGSNRGCSTWMFAWGIAITILAWSIIFLRTILDYTLNCF